MSEISTKQNRYTDEELSEIVEKMCFIKEILDNDGLMKLVQEKAKSKANAIKNIADIKVAYNNLFKGSEELPKKLGIK